jgi:hypothetical protein
VHLQCAAEPISKAKPHVTFKEDELRGLLGLFLIRAGNLFKRGGPGQFLRVLWLYMPATGGPGVESLAL